MSSLETPSSIWENVAFFLFPFRLLIQLVIKGQMIAVTTTAAATWGVAMAAVSARVASTAARAAGVATAFPPTLEIAEPAIPEPPVSLSKKILIFWEKAGCALAVMSVHFQIVASESNITMKRRRKNGII